MYQLQGKVAVLTGAASGIGRATAYLLAKQGCVLALVDINQTALEEVATHLRSTGGVVSTHVVDVADRIQMAALPDQVVAAHGVVHIVINNAGVMVADTLEHQSFEDFDWLFGINFWGVVHGCKFFLPHLQRAGEGHIVNISSLFGFYGLPSQSSYCASKFAVRGFTESLRAELAGGTIGVTAIHPGVTKTSIMKAGRSRDGQSNGFVQTSLSVMEKYGGTPERVAEKVVSAIRHNQPRVRVGWDSYVTDYIVRISPTVFNWVVGKIKGKMGA